MTDAATLRMHARAILGAAVGAADARGAAARAIEIDDQGLVVGGRSVSLHPEGRIVLVGAGKAAAPMAAGVRDVLGARVTGTLSVKDGHGLTVPGVEMREAAHPVPDARGVAAAEEALRLAHSAGPDDLVLCLLSGGASALWSAPPEGVPLEDLQRVTDSLLRAGAPIRQLNAVRKHLSRIAGGQLARAAAPARVVSLILSDVVGSPLDVIGSGPTVADPTTYADALEVLDRFGVDAPDAVQRYLGRGRDGEVPETPVGGDAVFDGVINCVIGDNALAIAGAAAEAERLGYRTAVVSHRLEGEARAVARDVVAAAAATRDSATPAGPAALLWGGETVVTVQGDGAGGRNQELALAAAILLENVPGVCVASFGTDGTDGPTDAAGGVVDGGTLDRAREQGRNPLVDLRRNDSYHFLAVAGDLLVTGPTGTHVNDVVLALVLPGSGGAREGDAAPLSHLQRTAPPHFGG